MATGHHPLYRRYMATIAPGHYEVVAIVPTGVGSDTETVKHRIRHSARNWVLVDDNDLVVLERGTKKATIEALDEILGDMLKAAEKVAEQSPDQGKDRYPFDRSTAEHLLAENSSEYRTASFADANTMVGMFLTDWYADPSSVMSEFAYRWVTRRSATGQEGKYDKSTRYAPEEMTT